MRNALRALLAMSVLSHAAAAFAAEPRSVEMIDRSGERIGTVRLTQTPNGVLIEGELHGLRPGERALHLHDVGRCEPPFESAGGHFNPEGHQHGFAAGAGPHAGDLPNIHVDASGVARFDSLTENLSLSEGPTLVDDANGAALILHARGDDYRADPSGGAGERIACGVVAAPR